MKYYLFFVLFFKLIQISFLFLPLWNLKESSIDLLSGQETTLILYNQTVNHSNLCLLKKLSKKIDNSQLEEKNIININGYITETNWEDIGSFYINESRYYYICPKGKNFLTIFDTYENNFEEVTLDVYGDDWELFCYPHPESQLILIAFLNSHNENKLYIYDLEEKKITELNAGLKLNFLDFLWPTQPPFDRNKYYIYSTIIKNAQITFQISTIYFKSYSIVNGRNRKIEKVKLNYFSYFTDENNTFYWINYNTDKDFTSGYSNTELSTIDPNIDLKNIKLEFNYETPFKFVGESKIEKLKFIRNTKYVFYKIMNNNRTYHGIIDIRGNKIIFNTDEDIKEFKPLTNHSLLAITESTAYEVCIIKDSNGECISSCGSSKTEIIDSVNHNHCGSPSEKCSKITLYPENICINYCNTTIYELDEYNKKCGLCKDLYNDTIYKVINETGCISNIGNGFYIIDKNLKILGRCHEKCKSCLQYSNDITNQYCKECYDGLFLQNDTNNCLEKCPKGYFENDKYCLKCDESCETCEKNKTHCTKCLPGYYLNEEDNLCFKCDKNCKTCSFGKEGYNEHCLSCDQNKYLVNAEKMNQNCVEKCPEGTSLKNDQCILDDSDDNKTYIIVIVIVLSFLIITSPVLYIIRALYNRRKGKELLEFINDFTPEERRKTIRR